MSQQQNLYLQRINLVTDYIRQHIDEALPLEHLAQVAGFSPFHFHRIFSSITGETIKQFVLRLRLERSAAMLKADPSLAIQQAAAICGFRSLSHYSRSFKKQFGISARQWDRQSPLQDRKKDQVFAAFPQYTEDALAGFSDQDAFQVQRRSLPAQHLAYVRVIDSYQPERITQAYQTLIDWYQAQGGDLRQTRLYGMSQDDPDITPLELCRYDFCLSVPAGWQGSEAVSLRQFPACEIAYIHCVGDIVQVDRAWQYLYRHWLPRSRYLPDNLPAMEIYRKQPAEIGWDQWDLDCALALLPLA